MNRQAKRQAERLGQKIQGPRLHTANEIDRAIEGIKRHTTYGAVKVMSAVMAISLNDEYGFGTNRIQKLLDKMKSQLECIEHNTVNINDIYTWCENKNIRLF
jgi:hypothetical protein